MIDLRENASTVSPPDVIFVTAAQIASPTAAMLANLWHVNITGDAAGTEATPFANTVA